MHVPTDMNNAKRSIFADDNNSHLDKFYDQIAWFKDGSRQLIDLEYLQGSSFDFLPYVYVDQNLTKFSKSFRISDHYPLWVEFGID